MQARQTASQPTSLLELKPETPILKNPGEGPHNLSTHAPRRPPFNWHSRAAGTSRAIGTMCGLSPAPHSFPKRKVTNGSCVTKSWVTPIQTSPCPRTFGRSFWRKRAAAVSWPPSSSPTKKLTTPRLSHSLWHVLSPLTTTPFIRIEFTRSSGSAVEDREGDGFDFF